MEDCERHQNIDSLMLCMEPECWDILCCDCLYKHDKEKHLKNQPGFHPNLPFAGPNKELKIKALKSIQSEIVNFLTTVKALYQKELKRMENIYLKVTRDFEDNLEKIRSAKERILDLIIDVFQRIEDNYKAKVNLDESSRRCENLIDKMKNNLSDINIYQNCFSDTYNYHKDFPSLQKLIKKYGHNELSEEQFNIVSDVHEIALKNRESFVGIDVDESRLYSMGMELSKYVKVIEDQNPLRSKDMMVELEDTFKPEAAKFIHFFEDGTRNLHLFVLDRPFQDPLCPKHEVLNLANENFLVPNHHRSVVTPQGEIFLTGGNEDRSGRDSTLAYKFDFAKKVLEPIDSMIKPRNSHGMAYLDGFLYVIGGISNEEGCITGCERYGINERKAWEKIGKLNVPAYGASLCSFRDKVLYKFGGKKNSWELSNTIEVYSPEKDTWTVVPFEFETQFDRRNFVLPCYSASTQINNNEIIVLGGSDGDGNNLVQTFIFHVSEKEENKQKNFVIREVNKRPLPDPECFDMGQVITFNRRLYCLQNSPIQALGFSTTPGGTMGAIKKLLAFNESQWIYIKR